MCMIIAHSRHGMDFGGILFIIIIYMYYYYNYINNILCIIYYKEYNYIIYIIIIIYYKNEKFGGIVTLCCRCYRSFVR